MASSSIRRGSPLVPLGAVVALALLVLAGCTTPQDTASSSTNGGTGSTPSPSPGGAGSTATCTASPEMTVGPYFLDGEPNRSDIRADYANAAEADGMPREEHEQADFEADHSEVEDADEEFIDELPAGVDLRMDAAGAVQAGAKLSLTITVNEVVGGACQAMDGAKVDIWHTNAVGKYSGYAAEGTSGEHWLRGNQVTTSDGKVTFTTIWPGWYQGRAVHIHVKVREGNLDFTSQFFFDEAMSKAVYQGNSAYTATGKGTTPDTPNASDGIYRQGGDKMILLTQKEDGSYTGTKTIVVT